MNLYNTLSMANKNTAANLASVVFNKDHPNALKLNKNFVISIISSVSELVALFKRVFKFSNLVFPEEFLWASHCQDCYF